MPTKVSEAVWQERFSIVERFEASGLSLAEFARREGVVYAQLLAWRKRRDELSAPASSGFVPLVVEPSRAVSSCLSGTPLPAAEIVMPSGVIMRLFAGAEASILRLAAEALGGC